MAPLRQIRFRGDRFGIEQSSHPFNQFKIKVADLSGLKPFVNDAALPGPRMRSELRHVQLRGLEFSQISQPIQPLGLIRGDRGRPPNSLANFSAKLFFDVWDQTAPDTVARGLQAFVADIVSERNPMGFDIAIDFFTPDAQERTDDLEFDARQPARSDLAHPAQAHWPGPAK